MEGGSEPETENEVNMDDNILEGVGRDDLDTWQMWFNQEDDVDEDLEDEVDDDEPLDPEELEGIDDPEEQMPGIDEYESLKDRTIETVRSINQTIPEDKIIEYLRNHIKNHTFDPLSIRNIISNIE